MTAHVAEQIEYRQHNGHNIAHDEYCSRQGLGYHFNSGKVTSITRDLDGGHPVITIRGISDSAVNSIVRTLEDYGFEVHKKRTEDDARGGAGAQRHTCQVRTGDISKVIKVLAEQHEMLAGNEPACYTPFVPDSAKAFILEQETPGLLAQHIDYIASQMDRFPNDYFRAAQIGPEHPVGDADIKDFAVRVGADAGQIAAQLTQPKRPSFIDRASTAEGNLAEGLAVLLRRYDRNVEPDGSIRLAYVDASRDRQNALRDTEEKAVLGKVLGSAEAAQGR